MWIFTTFGFFSVVRHREKSDTLLVRTRVLDDARILAMSLANVDVERTPAADYPYRLSVKADAFAKLMADCVDDINYDNFKNAVAYEQSPQRARLYGEVWGTMHMAEKKLGRRRARSGRSR